MYFESEQWVGPFAWQMAAGMAGICAVSMAWAAPHKVLDLRTMSDPAGGYEISLCSRPSPSGNIPGHAFVTYAHRPKQNARPRILSLGFTTSSGAAKAALSYKGWLGVDADGYLKEENYSSVKEKCLVAQVDKSAFDRAWSFAFPLTDIPVLESLTFKGIYTLGENDCMDFMILVATSLKGVKVPQRGATEFPQPYLRRLIDSN
ncbi:hypothetical protein [Rubrivivax rivuli]|uniref:Uncharacterized protein n=1 Tax=Rubrivivax rivuli TaxID=1862385 RepID=A0A437RH18_9BURK|nr:hypothetical protein [Rubrivivax rivuli]RVU46014.1 hypothetical protein EOE66_09060 [Rubrivivax rivuli]